eukprot:144860-Chlamydomonas_euryale.AAC.7
MSILHESHWIQLRPLRRTEFDGYDEEETVRVVMTGNQEPKSVDITQAAMDVGAEPAHTFCGGLLALLTYGSLAAKPAKLHSRLSLRQPYRLPTADPLRGRPMLEGHFMHVQGDLLIGFTSAAFMLHAGAVKPHDCGHEGCSCKECCGRYTCDVWWVYTHMRERVLLASGHRVVNRFAVNLGLLMLLMGLKRLHCLRVDHHRHGAYGL